MAKHVETTTLLQLQVWTKWLGHHCPEQEEKRLYLGLGVELLMLLFSAILALPRRIIFLLIRRQTTKTLSGNKR